VTFRAEGISCGSASESGSKIRKRSAIAAATVRPDQEFFPFEAGEFFVRQKDLVDAVKDFLSIPNNLLDLSTLEWV
jgi:hypothetical protein